MNLKTTLDNGMVVSTVSIDFGIAVYAGYTHETMVFPSSEEYRDLDMDRYHSADEARVGHAAMVAKWQQMSEEDAQAAIAAAYE